MSTMINFLLLLPCIFAKESAENFTRLDLCKVSHLGLDYTGTISKTESKVLCQSWSAKNPIHKVHESYKDDTFPELSKEKARNYCRNPSKDPLGPWCYTMDPNLIDETCAIPLCKVTECRLTGPGMEYFGSHSKSSSDINCLKWDKKRNKVRINDALQKIDKFNKYKFPDQSLSSAKKYCRNPDGDIGGPWCFTETEKSSVVQKTYCDIPFCDDPDCLIFSKNLPSYSHYISFPRTLNNFSFGIKLWDPDSFLEASAKLVLSVLPLPINTQELDDLGIGIELLLTNKYSTLKAGNKDKPELEKTHGVIKSTQYTYFNLDWDKGFITFAQENIKKPIFLQEINTRNNLLGKFKDQFFYYSLVGTNVLWTLPFCEDDKECDVHTTVSSKHQLFFSLRENDVGYDLDFNLRTFHSGVLSLFYSPTLDFPIVKITLGKPDGITRITYTQYDKGPTLTLLESKFPGLLSYWKWSDFSVKIFGDTLHLYWTRDVGTFLIMEVKNDVIKSLRWFSPSSENSVAHWTFNCEPPVQAAPPNAYLPECSINLHETSYAGHQHITNNGLPCLPWSGKKLLPSSLQDKINIDELLNMHDYCRDPFNERKGTYCHAISESNEKRISKQYCKLRKCKSAECRMAGTGNDYIGKVNTTRTNRTCQYWIADIPLALVKKVYDVKKKFDPSDSSNDDLFSATFNESLEIRDKFGHIMNVPEMNQIRAQNKLRKRKRELFKKEVEDFQELTGNLTDLKAISEPIKDFLNETVDEPEVRYVKVHNIDLRLLNGTLYADMSPERAENFCRNPLRSLAGSWCYTTDPEVSKDICYVPDCDKSEECMVFLIGKGRGRELFILPHWKEAGVHGGLHFSLKQWNPDILEGIQFEIISADRKTNMLLVIGANNNEKIILYKNNVVIKEKTLPHIISSGKWVSLWLQIRSTELLLGYEGVKSTLFEWTTLDESFKPMYIDFMTITGNQLGIFFKCDECHVEKTTTPHFTKIMPINIWTTNDEIVFKNFTLQLRGVGAVKIRLMYLPGSGENYVIKILDSGKRLSLVKNIKTLSRVLRDVYFEEPIIKSNAWSLFNITFSERFIHIDVNNKSVLDFNSSVVLLFYYFSIAVEEDSWAIWVANCEPLDIDGPPKDGGWSHWSSWECTVTCGGGGGYRTRTCSNPRPNIYGELCIGSPTSTGKCNEFECGDLSPETFDLVRQHLESSNTSIVLNEGETAVIGNNIDILTRVSTESPNAFYEWTLNGLLLKSDPGHVDFMGDDIMIKNVRYNDSGVYICVLRRIHKERLILQVVSVAVITKIYTIDTRATLPINLQCKSLHLGYVYSDLNQKWLLNGTVFINYGTTTLAAVSNELIKSTNRSMTGEWWCVITQDDLKLKWVTNIIKVNIKKRPSFYTHLMEDPLTKPIFGRLKYEAAVIAVIIIITITIITCVVFGLYAYLRWGRLPGIAEVKRRRRKKRKRLIEQ